MSESDEIMSIMAKDFAGTYMVHQPLLPSSTALGTFISFVPESYLTVGTG